MNLLIKYCPTYTRLCVWLWNSPTFTTWGKFLVQSLSLFAVTPLLLTRFDETEVAAWYLFSSLNFFGNIISMRLGLTFSRMFAFAMGGASNLAPIQGKREQENGGEPNWEAFGRAYGTIGSLNLGIGWVNVLIALAMGWYGLSNILEGYDSIARIWAAFGLMQMIALLGFIFQRYAIALQGMNYVALSNRWQMIFSILSICVGCVALSLGADILILVLVMQPLAVLGLLLNRFLLRRVEGGRVLELKAYGFDREVFVWAWPPVWKGFVKQFGVMGGVQLTTILYTGIGSKADVASYLFAVRMMTTLNQVAQAPMHSVHPLMSKLRAVGDLLALRSLIRKRMGISLALIALGVLVGGLLLPFLMTYIGSSVAFMSLELWLLLGGLSLVVRFNSFCGSVAAVGNEIIYYWQPALAAIVGSISVLLIGNQIGMLAPILASTVPLILFLNVGPLRVGSKLLEQRMFAGMTIDSLVILVFFTGGSFLLLFWW
jgi:hypothetical protein